jgi:hypothetical protein
VLACYALTVALSWGGVALLAGPLGVSGGAALLVGLFLAQAAGPSTAGLVLTGLLDGRDGFRDLLARKAIGGTSFFSACLAVQTEDPADGRLHQGAPPRSHKPHHSQGR